MLVICSLTILTGCRREIEGPFRLWISYDDEIKRFRWALTQIGSREELAAFLEEWVPRCPDPELLNEALQKLSTEIPDGVL